MKKMMPYLLCITIMYVLLPLVIKNTGVGMIVLLLLLPLFCFLCGVVYGYRHAFHIGLPLMMAILFIPVIFIYFNSSAWIYALVNGGSGFIGMLIACAWKKSKG